MEDELNLINISGSVLYKICQVVGSVAGGMMWLRLVLTSILIVFAFATVRGV